MNPLMPPMFCCHIWSPRIHSEFAQNWEPPLSGATVIYLCSFAFYSVSLYDYFEFFVSESQISISLELISRALKVSFGGVIFASFSVIQVDLHLCLCI